MKAGLLLKRAMDITGAILGLILLSPLLLFGAVGTWLTLGRPVFFRQPRPGLQGREFEMLKFRTMRPADRGEGVDSDGARLSGFGKLLRATSIDELPELWNVLRGEMSLVGPRPLLTEYLPRYTERERRRHDVLPGLTGWAQVNGRNAVDWNTRFELDLWYVENRSFFLDLKIIVTTVLKVLVPSGISAKGTATMTELRPPVTVIGAGGHAKVVISLLRSLDRFVESVYDDDSAKWGQRIMGVVITGPVSRLQGSGKSAVIAVGNNEHRRKIGGLTGLRWLTLVHPGARVDPTASIGEGSVIFAGVIVQAEARLGRHVIVNTGATVDHDCRISDHAHLAPGTHLAGEVRIGEGSLLGIGSVVLPGRRVGSNAVVGAGSVVTRDLPDGVKAYGTPARVELERKKSVA